MESSDGHSETCLKPNTADEGQPRWYTTYRTIKTVAMVFIWICMGFFLEISGPTLTDLKNRFNVNYEEISRVLSARSAGYFVGSLVGGFLSDRFSRFVDLKLSLSMIVAGVCTAVTPWLTHLAMVGVAFHIVGWCEGFLDTGGNALLLQLWGENAPSPVQAIHFGFGVGAFLAPYLARPFLAADLNVTNNTAWSNVTNTPLDVSTNGYGASTIEIPYLIIGLTTMFIGCLFIIFQIKRKDFENTSEKQRRDDKSILEIISPASCADGNIFFGVIMFFFVFLLYIQIVGGERAYGKFIFSFARESELNFSQDDATFLNSLFWVGFMSGRFVSIILAHWVSPKIMLPSIITGGAITSIVLCIFWQTSPVVLWVSTVFCGFFISPLFPTGVLWCNRYLKMTGMAVAILFLGGATGGFIYQWLTGFLFEYYGPPTLMYVMAGCAATLVFMFIIMQIIACCHGDRFNREEADAEPEKYEIAVSTSHL